MWFVEVADRYGIEDTFKCPRVCEATVSFASTAHRNVRAENNNNNNDNNYYFYFCAPTAELEPRPPRYLRCIDHSQLD